MNTADSSIAHLDIALRRRFNFYEMPPRIEFLDKWLEKNSDEDCSLLIKVLNLVNKKITENKELGEDKNIGHSFFMVKNLTPKKIKTIWKRQIIPLLEEYYFFDKVELKKLFKDIVGELETEKQDIIINEWFDKYGNE